MRADGFVTILCLFAAMAALGLLVSQAARLGEAIARALVLV